MPKVVLADLSNFSSAALAQINSNNQRIEDGFDNTLSRDGTIPNQMGADIDMNENDILNVDNIDVDTLEVETLILNGREISSSESFINFPSTPNRYIRNNSSGVPAALGATESANLDALATAGAFPANDVPDTQLSRFHIRKYVTLERHGAAGNDLGADNRNAFANALDEAISGRLPLEIGSKVYRGLEYFSASAFGGEVNLHIIAEPGATLLLDPVAAGIDYGLFLDQPGLKRLKIEGQLLIDGNNKASRGITIDTNSAVASPDIIEIEGVHVRDLLMAASGVTAANLGFHIQSRFGGGVVRLENCSAVNISRHLAGSFSAGMSVVGFDEVHINKNTVDTVHANATGGLDNDGIKIYAFSDAGVYRKIRGTCEGNSVWNCADRWMKMQVDGGFTARKNQFGIRGSFALNANFTGLDLHPMGSGGFEDNVIEIGGSWTGGASAKVCSLQMPAASQVRFSKEQFEAKFNRNRINVEKVMPYGVVPNIAATSDIVWTMEVSGNSANKGSIFASNDAFTNWLYNGLWPRAITGEIVFKHNNNDIACSNITRLQYDVTSLSGTYSRTGTTVTVSVANHGFIVGDWVYLDFTSGAAADTFLQVATVPDANTLTVTHGTSGSTSGNVTLYPSTDHADHWLFEFTGNKRPYYGAAGNINYLLSDVRTSRMKVAGNAIGLGTASGRIRVPFDISKVLDGSEFMTETQRVFNGPRSFANLEVFRKQGGLYSLQGANRYELTGSKTFDPGSLGTGAFETTTVTVTGAAIGDKVTVVTHGDTSTSDWDKQRWDGKVTAADTVTVFRQNLATGTVDLASGTLTVTLQKG